MIAWVRLNGLELETSGFRSWACFSRFVTSPEAQTLPESAAYGSAENLARLMHERGEVRLTEDVAARRDVERRRVHVPCPATIFVGGLEPWHWIDQSYRYSHHLHRSGMNPEVHTLPRWGHFDILNEFREPGSPTLKAVIGPSR